jgi:hypothetical protein
MIHRVPSLFPHHSSPGEKAWSFACHSILSGVNCIGTLVGLFFLKMPDLEMKQRILNTFACLQCSVADPGSGLMIQDGKKLGFWMVDEYLGSATLLKSSSINF